MGFKRDGAPFLKVKFGNFFLRKRGQVTIFIIIAILLVVSAIVLFFFLRATPRRVDIPAYAEPIYSTFLSCIEDKALVGASVLGSQGGYIYLPEFNPGSPYMPFSSQLNFLGNPIPYWYYVSGNNIQKEQVPTKNSMESHLEEFIEERAYNCNYESYYEQGFEIFWGQPNSRVTIKNDRIDVDLEMDLNIVFGDENVLVRNHKVIVNSRLGSLYDSAKKVYEEQQDTLFLEEYGIDILRNYAPVDGVEITCSPLIWNAEEIFDELQEAIEANTYALNNFGIKDNYFSVNLPVREDVRFLNSRNWPHSFEVIPTEGSLLVSNPVGNQPGLGILGFCYVPYHYVYDMKYPVLIQVYSEEEIFQFPVAVIIKGNNPREPIGELTTPETFPELCQYKNTEVQVEVKDTRGNPVQAEISFDCFSNRCFIGQTSNNGFLVEDFPQCINGFVSARAPGFIESRYLLSTVSPGSVGVIMDKLYSKEIQLKLGGSNYNGEAVIYFISDKITRTVLYPEQRFVELAQGQYEIHVQIFQDANINFDQIVTEQCIEVPRPGILGVIGFRRERCFDIEIPEQIISQSIIGGGKQNYFVLESELLNPGIIEINAESFPPPKNMEDLQLNYLIFENTGLEVIFR